VHSLRKEVAESRRRERILLRAMGLGERPKSGDRGNLGYFGDSLLKLEEYMLKTTQRIDNILSALQQHREFLVKMSKRMAEVGVKDRLTMELDIMKNTLSILAMNGVEYDESLLRGIQGLQKEIKVHDADPSQLRSKKNRLDERFQEEIGRFNLESIYSPRKHLPGYG